jgi:hypothetical protein
VVIPLKILLSFGQSSKGKFNYLDLCNIINIYIFSLKLDIYDGPNPKFTADIAFFNFIIFNANETRVLDPRPKLLSFHMSDQATHPCFTTERRGEGRESRLFSFAGPRTCLEKKQSKYSAHLQSSLVYRHKF